MKPNSFTTLPHSLATNVYPSLIQHPK